MYIHNYQLVSIAHVCTLFTRQPNGTCGIGVTSIELVNFKARGNVITKANAIRKETRSLSVVAS